MKPQKQLPFFILLLIQGQLFSRQIRFNI